MGALWIAHVTVTDEEAYKKYAAGATVAIADHGGEFIARGGRFVQLEGKERAPHENLYFQLFDHRAIRSGDWKLTAVDHKEWELYNLAEDRSETSDLTNQHPKKVQELSTQWENWWLEAYGKPYSEFRNPTPPAHLRDDREGGTPYVPTAMP